jgi:precorrin-4/cobalt-precorrin-4 C11-methyltransferase
MPASAVAARPEVTPGVPSFAAAAAALGQELTLPEVAQTVVLTRTSGRASAMPEGETLAAYAATGATLAIHLSIHVLDKVVADLTPFYGADCPAAIVYRASWPDERVIRGTIGTIAAEVSKQPIERTALILVGKVLSARDFRDSALYDAGYQRRFRGRQCTWRGASRSSRRCPTSRRARSGWQAPAPAIPGC